MKNYIAFLVEMRKACLNCRQSRARKDKEYFQDSLFAYISRLGGTAKDELALCEIDDTKLEDILDFISEVSLCCNDCDGKTPSVSEMLSRIIDDVKAYLDQKKEKLARKSSGEEGSKMIRFPSK